MRRNQCSMQPKVPSGWDGTAAPNTPSLRAQRSNLESFRRGILDCFAEPVIGPRFARTRWLAMTEEKVQSLNSLQNSSPSPPVLFRSACEQPPSGPREGCELFHDFEGRHPCPA